MRERGKEECGGTRFLQKAGFPRTPSGKNSYMAGGTTNGHPVGEGACSASDRTAMGRPTQE